MNKLLKEEWDAKSQEEKKEIFELHPESVPEGVSPDVLDEEEDVDETGVKIKNRIAEAVRKETKNLRNDIKSLTDALSQKETKPDPEKQSSEKDYFSGEAKKIAKGMIVLNEETGEYSANPDAVKNLIALGVQASADLREIEKSQEREVNRAINKLDTKDKKLLGDDIREELDRLPIGTQVTEEHINRAILIAKGRNAEKLVEDAKANLESQFIIEGEDTGEEGYVPGGKGGGGSSNKKPTLKQLEIAKTRGISVERQIALDEKLAKIKKEKNK